MASSHQTIQCPKVHSDFPLSMVFLHFEHRCFSQPTPVSPHPRFRGEPRPREAKVLGNSRMGVTWLHPFCAVKILPTFKRSHSRY